jgi:predicted dehydrogenase
LARAWYNNTRLTLGRGKQTSVPANFNYELWQGPAPRVPYTEYLDTGAKDYTRHYNWHWFWHYGNGELGNNGVHALDVCRWGMGVDYPIRVTSSGGRYAFDDDQQTPDTHCVAYEFPGRKQITWEGLSCNNASLGFVTFYGEKGSLALNGSGAYVIYDVKGKELKKVAGSMKDDDHVGNFLAAIRDEKPRNLNAEIQEGYKSTLLCHLGNIAQRTGRTLNCNAENGHILGDEKAMAYWSREYEKGWEPKV